MFLGLVSGDEILVINGKVVSDLDMVFVENMLIEINALCMTIRSCRVDRPINTTALMEHADIYIDNMVCPPPPTQSRISDKVIGELIVPAPHWGKCRIFQIYFRNIEQYLCRLHDSYTARNSWILPCMNSTHCHGSLYL